MNSTQSLGSDDLQLDLAFTGFLPDSWKNFIDQETDTLLTNCDIWSNIFKVWIRYLRHKSEIRCSEMLLNNNFFSLGLIFSDDLSVKKLNNKWRQKNVSTDVLSFPTIDKDSCLQCGNYLELGDIIVSVETALKQAKIQKHGLSDELRWLVSHGFLHLLGWDHPNSTSLEKMLFDQDQLIHESNLYQLNK